MTNKNSNFLHLLCNAIVIGALGNASAQMSTEGSFAVQPSGSATYQVPIKVPPGIAGMEPKLAFTYDSQAPNGILGVGWSLSGMSAIARCPKTMVQDGVRGSVKHTGDDRFCLDGKRLVSVKHPLTGAAAGLYGSNGTYYTTEMEEFSSIQSLVSAGIGSEPFDNPYYGPSHFVVRTKAGLVFEYGNTTDSRVAVVYTAGSPTAKIRSWLVNKVSDSKGNYIRFTYSAGNNSGQVYPTAIHYTVNDTPGSAVTASSYITFTYNNGDTTPVPRPDVITSYEVGGMIRLSSRLTKLSVYSGSLVKDYKIQYRASATAPHRSVIETIQECDASAVCLPPLTFSWTTPQSGWSTAYWQNGPGPGSPIGNQCLTGDFDGNGRTDLACYNANSWQMALSTSGSGWSISTWPNGASPGLPVNRTCFVGDFNGDTVSDIACYTDGGGNWHVMLSSRTGWNTSFWSGGLAPGIPVYNQCVAGDINGDSRTDIACYTGSNQIWAYSFSTGSGWTTSQSNGGNGPGTPIEGHQCLSGDYNGDGKMDLACTPGSTSNWTMSLSTDSGTGWAAASWGGGNNVSTPISAQCMSGDYNGDGRTDIACTSGSNSNWVVQLSTGTGWFTSTWANGNWPGIPITNQCINADLNGDGMTDMACYTGGSATWVITLSTGSGWAAPLTWAGGTSPGAPIGNQCTTGEFNGDSRTDIMCYTGTGGSWQLAMPSSEFQSLVNEIDTGLRSKIKVYYTSASRSLGNRYLQTQSVQGNPGQYTTVTGAPLVADVDVSDGLGGNRRTSYWYDTAVIEPISGRGYLGFKSFMSQDVATGLKHRTDYRLDFPYIGLSELTSMTTSGGSLLESTASTYQCLDPSAALGTPCTIPQLLPPGPVSARSYFVYPNQTIKSAKDLNGAGLPGLRTDNNSFDGYGNLLSTSTLTLNPDGSTSDFSKTVTSTYYNDVTNWRLGRLLRTVVSSSGPTVAGPVTPGSGSLPPTPAAVLPAEILSIILGIILDD